MNVLLNGTSYCEAGRQKQKWTHSLQLSFYARVIKSNVLFLAMMINLDLVFQTWPPFALRANLSLDKTLKIYSAKTKSIQGKSLK